MKNHQIKIFSNLLLFFGLIILSGCISVQLPGGKISKAKNIEFTAPGEPFVQLKSAGSDNAWISSKTRNTISYLSECGGNVDSSLEAIETDSLNVLSKIRVLKTDSGLFQGSESRQSIATGEIDGTPVQMALVIFKKNKCVFTLSYSGIQSEFPLELQSFENFKSSFQVP